MRGISGKPVKAITVGTRLVCADNTGAKELMMIGMRGYKGRKRMYPKAGVADEIVCSVKKGKPDIKKKVVHAVIIRQKKEYRRANGMRIKFEDNAAVLINEKGEPRGSEIKGPIAKEVAERWPKIAKVASIIV